MCILSGVTLELPFDDLGHLDAFAVDLDEPVAGHAVVVEREDHVADLEHAVAGAPGYDGADEHAGVVVLQAQRGAFRRVLQAERRDGQIDVFVVVPVADVLEEMLQHRRGDHVADVLRHVAAVTLERDADHLAVLQHRAAGVAGVDRRVDLAGEVVVHRRMAVRLEVDPRDDAARHAHALAADGIAVDRDARFQRRDAADFQRFEALEKLGVRHVQHREVAIVGDEFDRRGIFLRIVFPLDGDETLVADDVRVRDDARPGDDKPRADPALNVAGVPRHLVVGVLRGRRHADDALTDVGDVRAHGGGQDQRDQEGDNGGKERAEAAHGRFSGDPGQPRANRSRWT